MRGTAYDFAHQMAPVPGTRIGPYEIVGAIDAGAVVDRTEGLKQILAAGGR